jgi:hypothetical protein
VQLEDMTSIDALQVCSRTVIIHTRIHLLHGVSLTFDMTATLIVAQSRPSAEHRISFDVLSIMLQTKTAAQRMDALLRNENSFIAGCQTDRQYQHVLMTPLHALCMARIP